jgi:hypothetical protein
LVVAAASESKKFRGEEFLLSLSSIIIQYSDP